MNIYSLLRVEPFYPFYRHISRLSVCRTHSYSFDEVRQEHPSREGTRKNESCIKRHKPSTLPSSYPWTLRTGRRSRTRSRNDKKFPSLVPRITHLTRCEWSPSPVTHNFPICVVYLETAEDEDIRTPTFDDTRRERSGTEDRDHKRVVLRFNLLKRQTGRPRER